MSANSLLVSQASTVSGLDTAGALARTSGDAANVLPSSEGALVQKGGSSGEKIALGEKLALGGKRSRKTKGRKTKSRKSMFYSGGKHRKSHSRSRRRR